MLIGAMLFLVAASGFSPAVRSLGVRPHGSLKVEGPSVRLYAASGSGEMPETSMSVDELKAELEMRGVTYDDCISKTELVSRLVESRAKGKADPELLNKFKEIQEDTDNLVDVDSLDDAYVNEALAGDNAMPGGMDPAMMKALASDPEIMNYLKDPKMQEIMQAVMTGGPDAIKKYLSDPDAMNMLQALSTALAKAGGPPK